MSADAIVDVALPLEDLSYGTDPESYDGELFPTDLDQAARQMGRTDYSCALTARAILRRARVDGRCLLGGRELDVLREPYANLPGLAVSLLVQLASHHCLWRTAVASDDLQPGTVVIIDGPMHVMTITGRSESEGVVTLETIEGGQIDPANGGRGTAIRRKSRQVVTHGGKLVVGREVYGCFDAGALPCLPEEQHAPSVADVEDTGPQTAPPGLGS